MTANKYLVLGCKTWNRRTFDEIISRYPGKWHFMGERDQLTLDSVNALNPRYIFFLHWSWKVPDDIVNKYECVCFHMTDVPYGRGGSPLQNLILDKKKQTKLTALRMDTQLDAGPVYMKEDLNIESGSAEEIYIRVSYKAAEMIKRIISENIEPVPQTGKPTVFRRRKPEESQIPELKDIQELYDFIRMLDAEGYPKAFVELQGFRFEFSRAAFYSGRIKADVTIKKIDENKGNQ